MQAQRKILVLCSIRQTVKCWPTFGVTAHELQARRDSNLIIREPRPGEGVPIDPSVPHGYSPQGIAAQVAVFSCLLSPQFHCYGLMQVRQAPDAVVRYLAPTASDAHPGGPNVRKVLLLSEVIEAKAVLKVDDTDSAHLLDRARCSPGT